MKCIVKLENKVHHTGNIKVMTKFSILNKYRAISNERSKLAVQNIMGSMLCKVVTILINLALIPISIKFLNTDQYGIWITLSSIVTWLTYFDIGLTQGFRNRFAEAKALGDIHLCRSLLTTTYVVITLIFVVVFFVLACVVPAFNWSNIFNIEYENQKLITLITVLGFFFSFRFILNVLNSLLAADQHNSWSSIIEAIGLILTLVSIFALSSFANTDSLLFFAIIYCGIPCIILLIATIFLFATKYKQYKPSLKYLDFKVTKSIVGLGAKIFVIQITNVLLFQLANIVILRYCGSLDVTQYNIANKYFGVLNMVFAIVITPFWSAFTDAKTKGDIPWIISIYNKLSKLWWVLCVVAIVMIALAGVVYSFWVPDVPAIPFMTTALMATYIVLLTRNNLFINLLNGLNKVNTQMWSNIVLCIVFTPLLFWTTSIWGVQAVQLNLITICFMQSLICQYVFTKNIKYEKQKS